MRIEAFGGEPRLQTKRPTVDVGTSNGRDDFFCLMVP
jgi:hypothetical protein